MESDFYNTFLIRWLSKANFVEIVSDPHAEYFYKRFGFVTTDQVESTPGGRYLPVMVLMKESH
jgi:hypothetical protein